MAQRPRDPNQLAKMIVDIAVGDAEDVLSTQKKSRFGSWPKRRLEGVERLEANVLTPAERADIARTAATVRWKKD